MDKIVKEKLAKIKHVALDMDGTIYMGDSLFPYTIPFLETKLNEMYQKREEHFGNARAIRNLFEHAINLQATRLVTDPHLTNEELATLTLEDILPALEVM